MLSPTGSSLLATGSINDHLPLLQLQGKIHGFVLFVMLMSIYSLEKSNETVLIKTKYRKTFFIGLHYEKKDKEQFFIMLMSMFLFWKIR